MKKISFVLYPALLIFLSCCHSADQTSYNITSFGAKGDGKTLNTTFIQHAIDKCHESGGGTVIIPPGEFVTGTIILKSNVNLFLSPGASLVGSLDTADYWIDGIKHGIIWAYQARNISITGTGEINGKGTAFHMPGRAHTGRDYDRKFTRQGEKYFPLEPVPDDGPIGYDARPGMMIVLVQCEDVEIKDVKLADSPEWTIRIGDCDDVLVTGISIHNNLLIPNSDGIHCTTSRNIRISDCDIRAGDDAVIVTGFGTDVGVSGDVDTELDYTSREYGNKTGYSENVVVTNCLLQSRSSGIRVGYGMNNMRNCVFSNLVIYGSNRGIGVFSRDEGSIENLLFSDIVIKTRLHSGHWWGNGEPIHVSAIAQTEGIELGKIKNVRFRNIIAESENGIMVYGAEESSISNLVFEQVQLHIKNSPLADQYGGNCDLRPTLTMETAIFEMDIPGMYCNNTNGLTINDFQLKWDESPSDYFTQGIYCTQFRDIKINGFKGRQAHTGQSTAALLFENGSGLILMNLDIPDECKVPVRKINVQ